MTGKSAKSKKGGFGAKSAKSLCLCLHGIGQIGSWFGTPQIDDLIHPSLIVEIPGFFGTHVRLPGLLNNPWWWLNADVGSLATRMISTQDWSLVNVNVILHDQKHLGMPLKMTRKKPILA